MKDLLKGFVESAEKYPFRPALCVNDQTLTYSKLSTQARQIASALAAYDASNSSTLGCVFAYRSVTAYTGILATLLAGKGYVPLSPLFPKERTIRMLALSEADTIILDKRSETSAIPVLSEFDKQCLIIMPDFDALPEWTHGLKQHRFLSKRELQNYSPLKSTPTFSDDDIAYLLFTSGSTGIPKGVMVSHRNVASYINSMIHRYEPGPEDRFSQFFDLTFDLSVHDMFVCWASGAALHMVPEKAIMGPGRFIREHALTFWFAVPSSIGFMSRLHMLKPGALSSLRWSLFCGEPLPMQSAEAWVRAAPDSVVENLYGPTEATIAITLYRWQPGLSKEHCRNGVVPIGKPYPGQQVAVVNADLEEVAAGTEGELCLSGSQVTPGYWRNTEETRKRFVTLPGKPPDQLWYRTGDLVLKDCESGLVYIGRIDHQMKILGHRVERQEIENTIRTSSNTELVAVIGWPQTDFGADGVIAFVGGGALAESEIITACKAKLPEYMIPKEVHFLDEFPLNANGKIDYKSLLQMRKDMNGHPN